MEGAPSYPTRSPGLIIHYTASVSKISSKSWISNDENQMKKFEISKNSPRDGLKEDACQVSTRTDEWKYGFRCTKVGMSE